MRQVHEVAGDRDEDVYEYEDEFVFGSSSSSGRYSPPAVIRSAYSRS
jgi:hypothetical protein